MVGFGRLTPLRRRIDGGLGRGRCRRGSVLIFKLGQFWNCKIVLGLMLVIVFEWCCLCILQLVIVFKIACCRLLVWCLDARRFLLFCPLGVGLMMMMLLFLLEVSFAPAPLMKGGAAAAVLCGGGDGGDRLMGFGCRFWWWLVVGLEVAELPIWIRW
ncbi:hypothetical protein QL285_053096 [Trifolium repens]|nr:hypothetical protein QL285_053096 [Trifolium repens]